MTTSGTPTPPNQFTVPGGVGASIPLVAEPAVDRTASMGELVKDVSTHMSTLVRSEIELAKLEITETVKTGATGGAFFGVAAVIGAFSIWFFWFMIAWILAIWLPIWAAFTIEVLGQLPELPPGWGAEGPLDPAEPGRSLGAPRATIVDVAPTGPAPATPVAPAAPANPAARDARGGPGSQEPAQSATERTKRRHGPIIAAAITAVLVVGLVLVLRFVVDGTTTTTDPPTTPTSTGPSTSTAASTAQTPSPATLSRVSPTATASATAEDLRTGDVCSWQQQGDRRAGVDGVVLVCTLADGTYQWLPG